MLKIVTSGLVLLWASNSWSMHNSESLTPNDSSNQVSLSMPERAVIPVRQNTLLFKVTNTGTEMAYNIHAQLPDEWTEVTQDSNSCSALAPKESCELSFTSTKPYLAKLVVISGDNTLRQKIPFAFSLNGYLVFAIHSDLNQASVIYTSNSKVGPWIYAFWDKKYFVGATDEVNGQDNSRKIVDVYKNDNWWNSDKNKNPGAAVQCARIKAEGGKWYLPAVNQMFSYHFNWGSEDNLNKYSNSNDSTINRLMQLGFGNFSHGSYWSSTELDTRGRHDFNFEPTAQGVLLKFIYHKGHRHDHSADLIPLERTRQLNSRCVKEMSY